MDNSTETNPLNATPDSQADAPPVEDRPGVRLPCRNVTLAEFAKTLAMALNQPGRPPLIFDLGGVPVFPDKARQAFAHVTPDVFRTWAEQFVETFLLANTGKAKNPEMMRVPKTMAREDAQAVLAAPQFRELLPTVKRYLPARTPAIVGGELYLRTPGYDERTGDFTALNAGPLREVSAKAAVRYLRGLLREFCFEDPEQGLARVVAGMLSLWASALLPAGSVRPLWVIEANQVGSGKTLVAKFMVTPTLGSCPISSKAGDDEESRKSITGSVMAGRPVLVFDNCKGRLDLPSVEAAATARVWEDRLLGVNQRIRAECNLTLIFTGNGVSCSTDLARRAVWIRLHSPVGNPADRVFKRPMEEQAIADRQEQILSALLALVRHWDAQGRPPGKTISPSFPEWSRIIGGIVEAAGFGSPLARSAGSALEGDKDTADFLVLLQRAFVEAKDNGLDFDRLVFVGREAGLFENVLAPRNNYVDSLDKSAATRFGIILRRFDRTQVGVWTFEIRGNGRQREYWITGEDAPERRTGTSAAETGPPRDPGVQQPCEAGAPRDDLAINPEEWDARKSELLRKDRAESWGPGSN